MTDPPIEKKTMHVTNTSKTTRRALGVKKALSPTEIVEKAALKASRSKATKEANKAKKAAMVDNIESESGTTSSSDNECVATESGDDIKKKTGVAKKELSPEEVEKAALKVSRSKATKEANKAKKITFDESGAGNDGSVVATESTNAKKKTGVDKKDLSPEEVEKAALKASRSKATKDANKAKKLAVDSDDGTMD